MNYLREYGPQLITNGYKIVPIRRGTKAPIGVKGWSTLNADLNQLGQWASAGFEGIGLLARDNPGVDIDVLDAEVSQSMVNFVSEKFPGGLIRIGKAPMRIASEISTQSRFLVMVSSSSFSRNTQIPVNRIDGPGQTSA